MSRDEAQAGHITMSTGGDYSLATLGAKHVIDGARPLLMDAVAAMDVAATPAPFVMTDMGCADGGTSLATVGAVAAAVRERAPERPIQIVWSDQPRNDYNALVSNVHGLGAFETWVDDIPGVFPTFSGTSFYSAIVPPGTLDLGFSATAMHWLSRKPADIPDHIHATGASGAARAAFEQQGRIDQARILTHRARELRSGGRLVLVNFCRDDAGRWLGNTGGVHMFDTMNALWQAHVDEDVITADEYRAMTLPQYYNSVDEFRALFAPDGPGTEAGLVLEHIESRVVRCPYATDFGQHGDAARFAREYVPTLRSWTQSTFFGALDPARGEATNRAIVEGFYQRYVDNVAAAPAGHGMDYVHAYMVVSRR